MTRCIVCGVDESSGSRRAASVAARLARDLDSRVVLIHVLSAGRFRYGSRLRPGGRARQWRKRLKAIAAEHCFPEATDFRMTAGDAAEKLIDVAEQEDAELLVVAARDQMSVGEGLLGGVSGALIQRASCPVVLVPPGSNAPLDSASMRAVVCGVAGGDTGIAVLQLAGDLARRLGAELYAVHAYDEGKLDAAAPGPQRKLNDLLERSGVDGHGIVLPLPVVDTLEHVAEEERAGLIVIGSQTREGSDSPLHGSVATRQLAADGDTAVVVLPPEAELEIGSGHYELLPGTV
jgi:nucleotide-binding universal stress UspA family protein